MHRLNPVQVTLSGKLTRRNSLCQHDPPAELYPCRRRTVPDPATVSMQFKKLETDIRMSAIQEKSACQSWQQGLSTSCTGRDHCCQPKQFVTAVL